MITKFQSLIGTIKTLFVIEKSTNFSKFQSLIGTIKTVKEYMQLNNLHDEFQSLIGTIKTSFKKTAGNTRLYLFQSLIGTIKTCENCICNERCKKVSIPYRDDKNLLKKHNIKLKKKCFNPL